MASDRKGLGQDLERAEKAEGEDLAYTCFARGNQRQCNDRGRPYDQVNRKNLSKFVIFVDTFE